MCCAALKLFSFLSIVIVIILYAIIFFIYCHLSLYVSAFFIHTCSYLNIHLDFFPIFFHTVNNSLSSKILRHFLRMSKQFRSPLSPAFFLSTCSLKFTPLHINFSYLQFLALILFSTLTSHLIRLCIYAISLPSPQPRHYRGCIRR